MTGNEIPINEAERIAGQYGYTQVVVHGYDGATGIQHVTTWGESVDDSINAATGGNAIKKLLKWPEDECREVSVKQLKLEQLTKEIVIAEAILKSMADTIENHFDDDVVNLAKYVALSVLAEDYFKNKPL